MGYGLTVAVPRAVLAIPGHMGFAVFMGLFFGRAKLYENKGDMGKRNLSLWAGYLSAVVLHGIYDTCVMLGNVMCAVLFVVTCRDVIMSSPREKGIGRRQPYMI
jgi:RsiW-degrading membrane proteinase PrsW (M82 family)